jgi:hypothetical protein
MYNLGVRCTFRLVKVKVKQSSLQTLTGPEGSRTLRHQDFKKIGT